MVHIENLVGAHPENTWDEVREDFAPVMRKCNLRLRKRGNKPSSEPLRIQPARATKMALSDALEPLPQRSEKPKTFPSRIEIPSFDVQPGDTNDPSTDTSARLKRVPRRTYTTPAPTHTYELRSRKRNFRPLSNTGSQIDLGNKQPRLSGIKRNLNLTNDTSSPIEPCNKLVRVSEDDHASDPKMETSSEPAEENKPMETNMDINTEVASIHAPGSMSRFYSWVTNIFSNKGMRK